MKRRLGEMKTKLCLSLKSETGIVKKVRSVVKTLMNFTVWDEETQFRVLIVVDEAIQNAVDASAKMGSQENIYPIVTTISMTDDRFSLRVENSGLWQLNDGKPLARREILKRYQDVSLAERGRGLAIMAEYSEQISIRTNAKERIVTHISLRPQSAGKDGLE